MAKKSKVLTPEQVRILKRNHLEPALYEVLQDLPNTLLVRNIYTRQPAVLAKGVNSQTIPS